MVSTTLVKLSSPVARSCLIAIGVAILVDSVLTFFAASQYPYLIANTEQLYLEGSRSILIYYTTIGIAALFISISTVVASFKWATNFVLVHAVITGVFLPVTILVYFTSISSRYKVSEYAEDYREMITDYRVASHRTVKPVERQSSLSDGIETSRHHKLDTFTNTMDTIQSKFSCCGVDSPQDWIKTWQGFMPSSCCKSPTVGHEKRWVEMFKVEENHEFIFCDEANAYHLGCLGALKEDEQSKFSWLSNLIVFLMLLTITNSIISLLLFGLSETENMPYATNEHELAMVGVSTKPRPSQPEITAMRHRPSIMPSTAPDKEQISAISHAVRFKLANSSPRGSISGISKFSPAARRGSAFV